MCPFRTAVAGNRKTESVNRLTTSVVVIPTDNYYAIDSSGGVLLLCFVLIFCLFRGFCQRTSWNLFRFLYVQTWVPTHYLCYVYTLSWLWYFSLQFQNVVHYTMLSTYCNYKYMARLFHRFGMTRRQSLSGWTTDPWHPALQPLQQTP